jgi:glycosyltransferase involved in cell wall biosynthesis
MKISVLIHNLNRAVALERCLSSVSKQDYRPLEVVILDAGSTDDSLRVIEEACQGMRCAGIEVKVVSCPQMGVAASRNLAARHASGDLLCFIDNDAAFATSDCLWQAVKRFACNTRLAVTAFKVLKAGTDEIDPVTWVFRRSSALWSGREFKSFNFVGTGFCIRANAFWEAGGFWDHLRYSREEEDLAMALVDREWELLYCPAVAIRHYPEQSGRMSLAARRFTELCNGLLVLWHRLPMPVAVLAMTVRICTMTLTARREGNSVRLLILAVPQAAKEWRRSHLRRSPIKIKSAWRYAALHLVTKWHESDMYVLKHVDINHAAQRSSEIDVL